MIVIESQVIDICVVVIQEMIMKILFFGDVVGCVGWMVVEIQFFKLCEVWGFDFVVVNGENVICGVGLNGDYVKVMLNVGVDVIMLGDYVFD